MWLCVQKSIICSMPPLSLRVQRSRSYLPGLDKSTTMVAWCRERVTGFDLLARTRRLRKDVEHEVHRVDPQQPGRVAGAVAGGTGRAQQGRRRLPREAGRVRRACRRGGSASRAGEREDGARARVVPRQVLRPLREGEGALGGLLRAR